MGHAVILAGESPYEQIVIGDRAFIHQTDVFAGVIFPVQIGTFPVVPNIAIMCPLGPGAGLPLGKPGRPPAEPQPVKAEAKSTNSSKQFKKQMEVGADVCQQIASGERAVIGVMIESHLVEGNQNLESGEPLVYGKSVTDACIGWEDTDIILRQLADAVKARRG